MRETGQPALNNRSEINPPLFKAPAAPSSRRSCLPPGAEVDPQDSGPPTDGSRDGDSHMMGSAGVIHPPLHTGALLRLGWEGRSTRTHRCESLKPPSLVLLW